MASTTTTQQQALPRAAAAPPTPQEIERKLGSPTMPPPGPTLSSSLESVDLQRRFSNASRRGYTSASSGDEADEASPSLRANAVLSAISEAEDAVASGSESDASSLAGDRDEPEDGRGYPQLDPVRTSRDSGGFSDNVTLKSGYLMKKGEKRKTWKKRWFVLRGGQIAMYKTDKEYRLLRLIPITEVHSVSPVELKKHPNSLGIVTPRRTYYVQASSAADAQAWCHLIDRARQDYRAAATVTSVETPTSGRGGGDASGSGSGGGSGTQTVDQTPMGPTPAQTPRAEAYDARAAGSAAVPIPAASAQHQYQHQQQGQQQYGTSPSVFAPSSYQSTASSSQGYHPTAAPPPNSLVHPHPSDHTGLGLRSVPGAGGELELQSLDAGISQLSLGSSPSSLPHSHPHRAPLRSASGTSDTLALPSPSHLPPHALNFAPQPAYGQPGFADPRPSPGVVSSSEDEDGFEGGYDPAGFVGQYGSPGSGAYAPPVPPVVSSPPAAAEVPPAQADPNKVILAGYLMKQGKRKNWRKRWFVLQSGMLMYSRSHMDNKFHRQIPLTSILDAIEYDPSTSAPPKRSHPLSPSSPSAPSALSGTTSGGGERNYEHCFKIITPKRTYLVCAPSEEDEIKWLAALQCLVARRTQAAVMGTSASTNALPAPVQAGAAAPAAQKSLSEGPPPVRRPSQTSTAPRPVHGRQRSVTDAARQAVREVERRFHPPPPAGSSTTAA
ncbi:hypothetical protein JCM8097_002983 [Rhodosporidiobolus ruineniae]